MTNTSKDLAKTEEVGLASKQWAAIGAVTPSEFIRTRPGRGGKTFSYVEAGYVIDLLNTTFNGMWDFNIEEQQVGQGQVWVRGKLTVKFPVYNPDKSIHSIETLSKTQFGGSDIKTAQGTTTAIDIADDLKAAASDSLKKCASLFGFAADIYWNKNKGGAAAPASGFDAKRNWLISLIKSGKITTDKDPRILTDAEVDTMFTNYKASIGK